MKSRHLLAAATALTMFAAPVCAQDTTDEIDFSNIDQDEALAELRAEIEAEFGILSEFFKADPLTEQQEARLPMARQMTDKVFPVGTFGTMMKDAMDPLMGMVMSAVASEPRVRLAAVTGVDTEALQELTDEEAQEALDIFDPGFAGRTTQIADVTVEMVGRLFDAIEPAYRDAMARALTTRFDDAEMRQALAQLDNPIVTKLAQQAFFVQYDPQMMAIMEQLGPALMEVMPGMMEDFAHLDEQMADEGRVFTQLSAAERKRAARLLGKSESELEALVPVQEELEEEIEEDDVI